jgi:hypothetical protein
LTLSAKSELWAYKKIRKMIQNETDLLKASISFGVNPTPLRKIMASQPVSKYWIKKLYIQLKSQKDPNLVFLNSPKVLKLLSTYRLYKEKGSLDKVGTQLGLSRERIRQLLNKGTKLGLFDYQKLKRKPLPNIPKEKILEDYHNLLRLSEVAKLNDISADELRKLLQFHQIRKKTLHSIQIKKQKEKCVVQYFQMVEKFGRHPSTAELQTTYIGHYLSDKIVRFWRSIHIFRQELNIAFFPRNGKSLNGSQSNQSVELLRF